MRILCLGDVHLGASPDLGAVPYGEGSRLDDQRKVLARIAHVVEDEQVELCLFAGDAFHRRRPTPSEILVWRKFVHVLNQDYDVNVLAIDGNHDVETADRPSALQIVRQDSGYEVSRTPQVFHPMPQLAVVTLPWTPPARLLASLNGQVERGEVSAHVAELLIDSARELKAQIPKDKTAILLAHWSVSGSSLPNGLPVDLLREPILPLPDLEDLGFDCVVLGHIHKSQVLSGGDSTIFYTGSPAVVDFGEAATEHGVWIVDTGDVLDGTRFVPIEDRRFLTIDADLTAGLDPDCDETDMIAGAISEHLPLEGAVLRVRYRCSAEQARRVDLSAIRAFCSDAGVHKLYQVTPLIERVERARSEALDETMGEMEALGAWIGANPDLVGSKGEGLRELTARYLEEVGA